MTFLSWLFPLVLAVGIWLVYRNFREKPKNPGKPAGQGNPPETSHQSPLILTPTKTRSIDIMPRAPVPARGPEPKPCPSDVPLTNTPPIETLLAQEQSGQLEKDNWEIRGEVTDEFPVRAVLHLHYVDGGGLATERTVEVRKCGQYFDDVMVAGYCRLRNANRTFLVSRITTCFDEETGEVVDNIAQYLRQRYEKSPDYALDQFLDDECDTLRILLYVAKADGYLRTPEKAVIAAYCRETCGDVRVSDAMMANALAMLEVPSIHIFRRIVGALKNKPSESRARIIETVERLIATDKKTHPAEQEALDYLRKRWK